MVAIFALLKLIHLYQPVVIPVRVDPSVELLSIVFRLAGAEEYHMAPEKAPYVQRVDAKFGPYITHPAIAFIKERRDTDGLGFDAVASFAAHFDAGQFRFKVSDKHLEKSLDKRWKLETAKKFASLLKSFAKESHFTEFLKGEKEFYSGCVERTNELLAKRAYVEFFEKAFDSRSRSPFTVKLGLLNGGANYGVEVRHEDGTVEPSPIIGVYGYDEKGLPKWDDSTAGTIVHEFSHTYTNNMADQYWSQLQPDLDALFGLREEVMKPQAYNSGKSMLYESLVRAVTVWFSNVHDKPSEAEESGREEVRRGFYWVPQLAKLMEEKSRKLGKPMGSKDLMPELIPFFRKVRLDWTQVLKKLPKLASCSIKDGETLAPGRTVLQFTFDRPMISGRRGIGISPQVDFPEGKTKWSEDGKEVTLVIATKPNTEYTVVLGNIYMPSYESVDGWPFDPVRITFKTGPAS